MTDQRHFFDGSTELHIGWHPSRSVVLSMRDGDRKDALVVAVSPETADLIIDTLKAVSKHVREMDQ